MKGVYSSPDAILNRAATQALFPDNAYGLDSGGDPTRDSAAHLRTVPGLSTLLLPSRPMHAFLLRRRRPEERLRLLDAVLQEFAAQPVEAWCLCTCLCAARVG